jgi:hypothetical protein
MRQGLWIMVLGLALLAGMPARGAEQVGAVAALEGSADALRQGGDWTALAAGDPVMLGDRLRTAAASKLKVLFRDDSVLTLAASSEMTVDEQVVAPAAPASRFSLLVGTVRAVVTDAYGASGAHFEVETPTAIAGVRGTGFIANYDAGKEETVVVGLFDTTTVRSRADARARHAVALGPGQGTTVRRGSMPLTPRPMAENVLRNLQEGTNIGGAPPERGLGRGAGANAEPRVPKRPGQQSQSPEGRVIDQPIGVYEQQGGKGKPPPPPPPPPR